MSVMEPPDPDEHFAQQILEEYLADWTPEELLDARRAVELDDEERGR